MATRSGFSPEASGFELMSLIAWVLLRESYSMSLKRMLFKLKLFKTFDCLSLRV